MMKKEKTTYLKIYFELYLYQSILFILFLQKKQNNISQSISDNYRGKLVTKD